MLDAAEGLLAEAGPDALTVDAVVRRASASNGALYARFGDRLGLLAAVQDRFLDRIEVLNREQMRALEDIDDLHETLRTIVAGLLDTFTHNRNAFNAFMLQTLSIPTFRNRGAQATRNAAASVTEILLARTAQIAHPDPERAADFVFRTLFALATQLTMFNEGEVTGLDLDHEHWIAETTRLLHAYLTENQEPNPDRRLVDSPSDDEPA